QTRHPPSTATRRHTQDGGGSSEGPLLHREHDRSIGNVGQPRGRRSPAYGRPPFDSEDRSIDETKGSVGWGIERLPRSRMPSRSLTGPRSMVRRILRDWMVIAEQSARAARTDSTGPQVVTVRVPSQGRWQLGWRFLRALQVKGVSTDCRSRWHRTAPTTQAGWQALSAPPVLPVGEA